MSTDEDAIAEIPSGKQLANENISLKFNPDYSLQQRHVLEVMLDEDQPVFSPEQIRSRLKSDTSTQTIRRRLRELAELGLVNIDEYRNHKLYSINDVRSDWAVPGDLAVDALEKETMKDLLTFQAPRTLKRSASFAFGLSMYLFLLGALLSAFDITIPISSTNEFVTAGLLLVLSVYPLLLLQSGIELVRKQVGNIRRTSLKR